MQKKLKHINVKIILKCFSYLLNIKLIVISQRTYYFRLIADFCKIRGLEKEKVCFMYNGREVTETDTPESIGLKEGDNIDCFDRS